MSILIYLATIFWSLFPNLIHVFQGGENQVIKVDETNLVDNGDFNDGLNSFSSIVVARDNLSLYENKLRVNALRDDANLGFRFTANLLPNNEYYLGVTDFYTNTLYPNQLQMNINLQNSNPLLSTMNKSIIFEPIYNSVENPFLYFYNSISGTWLINEYFDLASINVYNVSTMKLNGVKNDDNVLFSDLTDEEIRVQLDQWISKYGDLTYKVDNTYDSWFNTGFVEKTAERDFLDYLGYFAWLMTPPIMLFITLNLIRRLI